MEGFLELGFELRLECEEPAEGFADSPGPRDYLPRLRYEDCLRFVECQSSLQIVGAEGLGEQWGAALQVCEQACEYLLLSLGPGRITLYYALP